MKYRVIAILGLVGAGLFPWLTRADDRPPASRTSKSGSQQSDRELLLARFRRALAHEAELGKAHQHAAAIVANQEAERLAAQIAKTCPDLSKLALRSRVFLLMGRSFKYLHATEVKKSIAAAEESLQIARREFGDTDWLTRSAESTVAACRKLARLPDDSRNVEFALEDRANTAHDEKRLSDAIALAKQLEEKERRVLGPDDPYHANTLQMIAQWQEEAGQYDQAIKNWEQVLTIRRKSLGDKHPELIPCLDGLASIERHRYRLTAALSRYDEAAPLRREFDGAAAPHVTGVRFDDFTVDSRKRYTTTPGITWKKGSLELSAKASVRRPFEASYGWLVAFTPEWRSPTETEPLEFSLTIGRTSPNGAAYALIWSSQKAKQGTRANLRLERLSDQSSGFGALFRSTSDWKRETVQEVELLGGLLSGSPWRIEFSFGYLTVSEGGTIRLSAWVEGVSDTEYWEFEALRGSLTLHQCADMTWIKPRFTATQQSQLIEAKLAAARWSKLLENRNYQEALPLAQTCVAAATRVLGPRHPAVGVWTLDLASTFRLCGNASAAEPLEAAGLEALESELGPHHPEVAIALRQMAGIRAQRGEIDAAEKLLLQALAVTEQTFGPRHPETAKRLKALGRLYADHARYASAIPYFEKALHICETTLGLEHSEVGVLTDAIAMAHRDSGNYKLAQQLFSRSVAIAEKCYGPHHSEVAKALDNAAGGYFLCGDFVIAEKLYLRALEIKRETSGLKHPDTATTMHNLASLYEGKGRYQEAEQLAQQAMAAFSKAYGPNHPRCADEFDLLATISSDKGDFAKAAQYADQAARILETAEGENPETIYTGFITVAQIRSRANDYSGAETAIRRAMQVLREKAGDRHPNLAAAAGLLAEVQTFSGNYDQAERSLEYAINLLNDRPEDHKLALAQCAGRLGELRMGQKRFTEAIAELKRSVALMTSVVGKQGSSLGTTLGDLGDAELLAGQTQAAEESLEQALAILEKTRGRDSTANSYVVGSLGYALYCNHKTDQARTTFRHSLQLDVEKAKQLSAIQAEALQLDAAGGVRALPLGGWLTATLDGKLSGEEVWEPILKLKGIVTSRTQAIHRALRGNPLYAEYLRVGRQLSETTLNPPQPPSDLNLLTAWKESEPALRQQWFERRSELTSAYQRLQTQLAGNSVEFRREQEKTNVSPADIVAALRKAPIPTALVDLEAYIHLEQPANGHFGELRLAAFVVRGDRGVRRVELGECNSLLKLLAAWRQRIARFQDGTELGSELRKRLWESIAANLDGIETVLISPDLEFGQLPWNALPGKKPGTFLIEDLASAVIPTPQMVPELLKDVGKTSGPTNVLIAGDINYGSNPGVAADNETHRTAQGRGGAFARFSALPAAQPEIAAIEQRFHRGSGKDIEILRGSEATESRFRQDAPHFEWLHLITHGYFAPADLTAVLTVKATDMFIKRQARAATFEIGPAPGGIGAGFAVRNGRCVVAAVVAGGAAAEDGRLRVQDEILEVTNGSVSVATKGKPIAEIVRLIRGPAGSPVRLKVRPKATPATVIDYSITRKAIPGQSAPRAPLAPELLSGLAFAGANRAPEAGQDDGILTALEISGLDLSKVNTVVLSACETGLGERASGEGLLGLQRAFQVAGAKTVVATLWKVDDRSTAALMEAFYDNVFTKKLGKLESLRQAQLKLLREGAAVSLPKRRGLTVDDDQPSLDGNRRLPYYWGAFLLSGDWR